MLNKIIMKLTKEELQQITEALKNAESILVITSNGEGNIHFYMGDVCDLLLQASDNDENIKGFAKGILNDFQAVYQSFISSWSNGPVEGQVNRLKNIKRQMYGRAGFELLRKRMVITSQS